MPEKFTDRLSHWTHAFGFNIFEFKHALQGIRPAVKDLIQFKRQLQAMDNPPVFHINRPCLADRFDTAGVASGHYFHQDLWVAQKIFQANPDRHVDIGSRVDGFVAHVAAFRSIEVFDIRPVHSSAANISFQQCDFLNLRPEYDGYTHSLSCLHALEHFGLGRYGDPISAEGYKAGLANLKRMLAAGGTLYFSVPIGPERIEFNAHRIFDVKTMLELTKPELVLTGFSYVDDQGDFHPEIQLDDSGFNSSFGCQYGCGIFEFKKQSGFS
jgi:hypothetical protein